MARIAVLSISPGLSRNYAVMLVTPHLEIASGEQAQGQGEQSHVLMETVEGSEGTATCMSPAAGKAPCTVRWSETVDGHILLLVTSDRQGNAEPRGKTEK